ncbi:CMRF35-like molecule 1, partial [Chaetura pelagica]
RTMGMLPGWGWLLVPVCQALTVPREVSGRAGERLSLRCWYSRGYESYNKYWCQGDTRGSCHKVVETAGQEAPQQHGRVSIHDNHVFCVVLVTVEDLSEEDAGSYWCGIERTGLDLMEPVTVRVVPALRALQKPGERENQPHSSPFPCSPSGPALSVLVPSTVLLSLLAAAG